MVAALGVVGRRAQSSAGWDRGVNVVLPSLESLSTSVGKNDRRLDLSPGDCPVHPEQAPTFFRIRVVPRLLDENAADGSDTPGVQGLTTSVTLALASSRLAVHTASGRQDRRAAGGSCSNFPTRAASC